jgi:hypothetical protein
MLLWNHLLIVKILPVTLFRGPVPAFREPPVTLKVVRKAACDSENCSESWPWMYTRDIHPMRVKESRNINLLQLAKQSLELVSVFKEASRNLTFIFMFNKQGQKFKTHVQRILNWFNRAAKTISIWWPNPFNASYPYTSLQILSL